MTTETLKAPSAEITVFSPLVAPTKYSLRDEGVSIGRAAECSIPIKDRYLSRKHAEIVLEDGHWVLKDCGSANGTYLNGTRVEIDSPLHTGDRIRLGDTEIVFGAEHNTDRFLSVADSKVTPTISIPAKETAHRTDSGISSKNLDKLSLDRLKILNALASELIEDRHLDELFGFILDRVMEHLRPSRAAIGLIGEGGDTFVSVEVRRQDASDKSDLAISRTLLTEVVEEKQALAFMDVTVDEKLSRAQSIIMQGIHSVLCAPMMIGDVVVGLLYVDYLFTQRTISEEDVRLVAQIARFAAIKLETTRLREESIQKRLMDEELKTAYLIQRRLLPEKPPTHPDYTFTGLNRPCRTVSGDYFDFVVRPDGRIYFVIADVSGKGVTAALLMAGLQASFRIFTKSDPPPSKLVEQLNGAMKENLPQSKFVTLFLGRLTPATGAVEFANAGHTPPCWLRASEVAELTTTDIVLGISAGAKYHDQTLTLAPGDSLVTFTDGLSEAEDEGGAEFGPANVASTLAPLHGRAASQIATTLENAVILHTDDQPLGDDVTLLIVTRNG
ncbi:MAG TPA: SpoIIE family protein phosphatase [Thermoanaerobaculia bacterium]